MQRVGGESLYRRIAWFVLGLALCAPLGVGQGLNPPYLKEMPTVDRVMKEVQVSDPKETSLRQIGAFRLLQKIITDMAGPRAFQRGQLTPTKSALLVSMRWPTTNSPSR